MGVDRRILLGLGVAAAAAGSACAQNAGGPTAQLAEPTVTPLWPGDAPGFNPRVTKPETVAETRQRPDVPNRVFDGVRRPMLTLYRPTQPNGGAILVIPGGSYLRVWFDKEGALVAQWLARQGFLAGAMTYRLPGDGWSAGPDTPMQDGQRALRLMRREAGASAKLGVMGFSAGGHLAGSIALRTDNTYARVDALDDHPARTDYSALVYAVTNGLDGAAPGIFPSLYPRVTRESPPMFIAHAADDARVPVAAATDMFAAMHSAGAPAELHVFQTGGHGFALQSPPAEQWSELFLRWCRERGVVGAT